MTAPARLHDENHRSSFLLDNTAQRLSYANTTVQDLMTSNVLVVERHTGVEQVAKALANNRVSAAPVPTSTDRVIGVVSGV